MRLRLLPLLLLAAGPAAAQEMRGYNRIPRPDPAAAAAERPAQPRPVARAAIDRAVADLTAEWNAPGFADNFAEGYYDKQRLADNMTAEVPRDARLRLESVSGVQTLDQRIERNPAGSAWLVSTVVAVARTRMEFNDARQGFLSVPGENEITFEVREAAP